MPLGYATFRCSWGAMRQLSAIAQALTPDDDDEHDITPADALAFALECAWERLRGEGRVSEELEAWLKEEPGD